jgi:hypothetical protein
MHGVWLQFKERSAILLDDTNFDDPADPKLLARIRIVLARTSHPGNIGSAARAMKTMGLSDLVLVAPAVFPNSQADAMAAGRPTCWRRRASAPRWPRRWPTPRWRSACRRAGATSCPRC